MHAKVCLLAALGLLLLDHIRLVLVINEVHNRRPRVTVVDVVAEAGSVNNGELDLELPLLKLSLDNLNLRELVKLLVMALRVVLRRGELRRKERVNERCLAETRLAYTQSVSAIYFQLKCLPRTDNHDR